MPRPTIIVNNLDTGYIDRLLGQPAFAGLPITNALNAELDRAQMCSPETMPHDAVTMNSRVEFHSLSDGKVRMRALVYPTTMADSNTQLPVMTPVGTALLGLHVEDTTHWELPGGTSAHLEVTEFEYQPEAAGDYLRQLCLIKATRFILQGMHPHPLSGQISLFLAFFPVHKT